MAWLHCTVVPPLVNDRAVSVIVNSTGVLLVPTCSVAVWKCWPVKAALNSSGVQSSTPFVSTSGLIVALPAPPPPPEPPDVSVLLVSSAKATTVVGLAQRPGMVSVAVNAQASSRTLAA